jgi:hypothetical protein
MGLKRISNAGGVKPPVLGKVKIGEKNSSGIPKSLDYFAASGHYKSLFHGFLGEKPSKIPIYFPKLPLESIFLEQLEWWESGILMGKSDGEKWFLLQDDGTYKQVANVTNPDKFKPSLRIGFCIDGIKDVFGIWVFESKASKSTLENIIGTLEFIINSGIEISDVKFDLIVEMRVKKLKSLTKKYPVVSLIAKSSAFNDKIIEEFNTPPPEKSLGIKDFD